MPIKPDFSKESIKTTETAPFAISAYATNVYKANTGKSLLC